MVAWSRDFAVSLAGMEGEAERRARFGYALHRALRERKMSERQLAKRLGIDPRRVSAWRNGRTLPNYYEHLAIMRELRVSEDLFRDPPPVPEEPYYPIEKYLLDAASKGLAQGLQDELRDEADGDAHDGPPIQPQP